MELSGKVVVVPVGWEHAGGLAERMAGRGATVVLVGPDGDAAGRLAAAIEQAGTGRPAIFVADGSTVALDALAAFLTDTFRDR